MRAEALAAGISAGDARRALTGLEPDPVVVARDRAQPEVTQSLDDYLAQRLTPTGSIDRPRRWPQTHADLLARIEKAYGCPPPLMVADLGARVELRRVHRARIRRSPRWPRSPTTAAGRSSASELFDGADDRRRAATPRSTT